MFLNAKQLVTDKLLHATVRSFVVFLCLIVRRKIDARKRNPRGLPLPPGPKGLAFVGMLFDNPVDKPWLAYAEWSKKYGDMVYYEVLGQPILILGSLNRVNDILEKRSYNYSDRVQMPMVVELMEWGFAFTALAYGSWWRRHRRCFNENFHRNAVFKYQPNQTHEVKQFLNRLLVTPEDFMYHIRHTFSPTIMNLAYGIKVNPHEVSPYVTRAEESLAGFAVAGMTGTFWVDYIPALKYVPSWFPGASFKRLAAHYKRVNNDLTELPFKFIEDQMKAGKAVPSLAATFIEADCRGYIGGADTTFFLAMTLYPEVQKKAQAEIDRVVGSKRLPDFSDRPDLPYINALIKETSRWNLVLPLAVGHMSSNDDEYDGYFIPKGTIVYGNAWSILHDPTIYTNPSEYRPERYLKPDPGVRDPEVAAFGFGRRVCPGRHMSDNSLYCIIVSTLAVYDIKAPVDQDGKPMMPKAAFTSGLLTYPEPFKCIIKPRSRAAEDLIRESVSETNND
ncbi:cytochrome P450 [Agrocybe pediades]|nr:cytochrome P450 [Agrocybe pediades]